MSEAFVAYESGDYEKAAKLFFSMLMQNPLSSELWHALASARKMEFRYDEAIAAWTMSSLINPRSPLPHFHKGECFLAKDQLDEAVAAFDQALERPCTDDLIDKIESLKEIING